MALTEAQKEEIRLAVSGAREEFNALALVEAVQMPAIADLAGGATTADAVAKINALLAALRLAGLLAT